MIMRRRRENRGDDEDYRRGYDRGYDMAMRDYNDYNNDYADYARGVKGTGRYGIGGSRYYGRRDRAMDEMHNDMNEDYRRGYDRGYDMAMRDNRRDYADYGDYANGEMELTESEMKDWKRSLKNADGTTGEHFEKNELMTAAEKMGIKFNDYDEKELCLTANMLYSDYCLVLKPFVTADKEPWVYVAFAKAFLEDKDSALKGGEKLSAYYNCIVKED